MGSTRDSLRLWVVMPDCVLALFPLLFTLCVLCLSCRSAFLAAHIPLFLYPFLHTVSKTRPFEYLRLTSLGVIGEQPGGCWSLISY